MYLCVCVSASVYLYTHMHAGMTQMHAHTYEFTFVYARVRACVHVACLCAMNADAGKRAERRSQGTAPLLTGAMLLLLSEISPLVCLRMRLSA